jgi:hypothetical protein
MIVFKLESDGGFIAGDTKTRVASYAYPTSEYATLARKMPATIAHEMMARANSFHAREDFIGYYSRLWERLRP